MAFDNEMLSHVGGASPAPRIYTYETEETRVEIFGAGYFNEAYTKLQVKDLIIVNNSAEVYTAKVTAVGVKSVTVAKTSFLDREYAYYVLSSQQTLALNNDGTTYTVVPSMTATIVRDFSESGGILTYNGVGGLFLFSGSIDFSCDKVADITVALSINGTPATDGLSIIRSFSSANKRGSASSNGIFQINTGDTFQVATRGDGTTGTSITVFTLNLTFTEV